jgi:hypothetical protein
MTDGHAFTVRSPSGPPVERNDPNRRGPHSSLTAAQSKARTKAHRYGSTAPRPINRRPGPSRQRQMWDIRAHHWACREPSRPANRSNRTAICECAFGEPHGHPDFPETGPSPDHDQLEILETGLKTRNQAPTSRISSRSTAARYTAHRRPHASAQARSLAILELRASRKPLSALIGHPLSQDRQIKEAARLSAFRSRPAPRDPILTPAPAP